MKQLKIRGKELKRLGYTNDKVISLLLSIAGKHFKRVHKLDVLEKFEKILLDPLDYVNDPVFGQAAGALLEKKKPAKQAVVLKKDAIAGYKIYGKAEIEADAIRQMDMAMQLPVACKGALMADAHHGYGLPIGGVLATYNAVLPYGVGMDIGCRMCMAVYPFSAGFVDENRVSLKKIIVENTRFGKAEFTDIREHEILEREEFRQIKSLEGWKDRVYHQLGTSGGGNHFVDFGELTIQEEFAGVLNMGAGRYFAVLSHSGSRNFGANIAEHYTRVAREKRLLPKDSAHLAWLYLNEEEGQEYWMSMNLAGDYASANHHIIHNKISKALGELPVKMIENHHNFAWKENIGNNEHLVVHRKGATPAGKGMIGIIPGSMSSPGYIVMGKGNEESLNSASHGAGRVLSRKKAKTVISMKQLEQELKKAGVELLGGGVDESPMVYKDIRKVMEYQKDLVDIIGTFYPVIVRMCGRLNHLFC